MGRETMLGGQRIVPSKLMKHGFVFRHPELAPMLREITGAKSGIDDDIIQEFRSAV
jgi:NAD dependent epimerase/dehydratase family enzyme